MARQQFRTQCPHSSWKVLHVSALTKTTRNEFSTFPARKHSNMNRLVIMRDAIRTQALFVTVFPKDDGYLSRTPIKRKSAVNDCRSSCTCRLAFLRFAFFDWNPNCKHTWDVRAYSIFDIILSHNAFRLLTKTFVLVKFRRVPHYYTHLFHIYTPVII